MKSSSSVLPNFRSPLLLSLLLLFLTVSCLSTEGIELTSSIQVNYRIPDLNNDVVRNEDTLKVLSARIVFQNMQLNQSGGSSMQLGNQQIVALYSIANNGQDLNLLNGELSEGRYSGLNFNLAQPDDPSLEDPEATIVVAGQYNDDLFKYTTGENFEKSIDFDQAAEIAEFNSSIIISIRPESAKWFLDETGDNILDPSSGSNSSRINANLIDSFQIQTQVFN